MKPSTKAMPLRVCARLTLAALATSTFSVTALAEQESLDAMTITANRMPTENAMICLAYYHGFQVWIFQIVVA